MLVLTRKVSQQIRLGDDITITILRAKGNSIRIGIDAPRGVRIVRGELTAHQEIELQAPGSDAADAFVSGVKSGTEVASGATDEDRQPHRGRASAPLSAYLPATNGRSSAVPA